MSIKAIKNRDALISFLFEICLIETGRSLGKYRILLKGHSADTIPFFSIYKNAALLPKSKQPTNEEGFFS